jgi:hypothetical protein
LKQYFKATKKFKKEEGSNAESHMVSHYDVNDPSSKILNSIVWQLPTEAAYELKKSAWINPEVPMK